MAKSTSKQDALAYVYSDANLLLLSRDAFVFRVDSSVLRKASTVFSDMLKIGGDSSENKEPIRITETANVFKQLLDIIYPDSVSLPHFETLSEVSRLLQVAEKYDVRKVIAVIPKFIMGSETLRGDGIGLYALACRYGWEDQAKWASSWTLDCDLTSQESLEKLKQIDRVEDLLKLQALHRTRREAINELFTGGTIFDSMRNVADRCPNRDQYNSQPVHSQYPHFDDKDKAVVRLAVLRSMERCASGADLQTQSFLTKDGVEVLWTIKCSLCQFKFFDKARVIEVLQVALASLPKTI